MRKTRSTRLHRALDTQAAGKPPFRCIEVVCGERACLHARRIAGNRILSEFAHLFPLPLPECDVARCKCRYAHYNDRRQGDRRSPFVYAYDGERRGPEDRRQPRD